MNKKPFNANQTKEFFKLLKTIEKTTKNQARISSYNPDDISSFMVEICPIRGVYQHAKFVFQIQLMLYPREFPNVICLSDIYHPNIEHGEDYHNVCLNLFDNWNRSFGLIDVIQGLIFLLYQPNINDPISSLFNSKNTNDETFRKNVYTSLHGGVVDGVEFLPNPGIIEYIEQQKQSDITEQNANVVEGQMCDENNSAKLLKEERKSSDNDSQNNDIDFEMENEHKLMVLMRNNNATPECLADIAPNIDDLQDDNESTEDTLPTRDIVSPNAFYSDLICSRYTLSNDKASESENGSDEIYRVPTVFDMYGFPPSTYASAESDLCDEYDSYDDTDLWHDGYYDDDIMSTNNDGDCEDEQIIDRFLVLSTNTEDPANVFLSKWLQLRKQNHQYRCSPASTTIIILTNILNPLHDMVGTFYLFTNSSHWRPQSQQAVRRIEKYDRPVHLMVWLSNLCRWYMTSHAHDSRTDLGLGQIACYSLFVALSLTIRTRLANVYNYGSRDFDCLFLH